MSYWLGQHLSEGGTRATDPLKDRIWLALQYLVTLASIIIAFVFLEEWGNRSLLIGGWTLAFGSSCLYLLFVRGRLSGAAQGVAAVTGVMLVIELVSTFR